jgi:predicted nucleic acid-binding protein
MRVAKVFIDTNVLLYTRDRELARKSASALHWLREIASRDLACINLQVLNEITHVMLRKRPDMSAEAVFASVDKLAHLGVSPVDAPTVEAARSLCLKTGYSWWDCLLLASAINLGCTHFLSEDLQDGQRME